MASSVERSDSALSAAGATSTARASKMVPPDMGASRTPVLRSSMLTSRAASAAEISATIPGWSSPRSSRVRRWEASSSGSSVRSQVTWSPCSASPSSSTTRAATSSPGTATSTMPANLPASRESWLCCQLPP